MNRIIIILFSLLLFSCNKNKETTPKKLNKKKEQQLSTTLLKKIKTYYNENYGGKGIELIEEKTDSIVNISYRSIPETKDDFGMTLMSISIPLKGKRGIYFNDLNSDQQEDVLITVNTEGGGGGGNVWWVDYFLFLKEKTNYRLIKPITNWQINDCQGYFSLEKIKNNTLIGNSYCYTSEDGRCCPSLEYKTNIKLINDQFKVTSTVLTKKRKQ